MDAASETPSAATCDCLEILACPVDGQSLSLSSPHQLRCEQGHTYPVVSGVAVLLRDDVQQTIGIAKTSLDLAREFAGRQAPDPFFIASLGLDDSERDMVRRAIASGSTTVDPVISHLVAATNGILYRRLIGNLESIPIPNTRLAEGNGARLLDIGCNWGRWSIAAARKGYRPIGIDPSLGAVLAAKRLAARFGLPFEGIVGDARHMPLKQGSVDAAFSYSVLQHFSKPDAKQALERIARAVRPGGDILIQMASGFGLRSFQHMARRRFREPVDFEVRYWSPVELARTLKTIFGSGRLQVDCYFGLGLQPTDSAYYSSFGRTVLAASEALRQTARVIRPLTYLADSLYLSARNVRPAGLA